MTDTQRKIQELYKQAHHADVIANDPNSPLGNSFRQLAQEAENEDIKPVGRVHYCRKGEHTWNCDALRCTSQPEESECPTCAATSHVCLSDGKQVYRT